MSASYVYIPVGLHGSLYKSNTKAILLRVYGDPPKPGVSFRYVCMYVCMYTCVRGNREKVVARFGQSRGRESHGGESGILDLISCYVRVYDEVIL